MFHPHSGISTPLAVAPTRHYRLSALVCLIYAAVLVRGIFQPWTGLHDWNGAFYSQLARNLLRYPFDLHHGIPVVAVGDALPADGEWSFYPTHPPGLVWCIAASFCIFGEHEWSARLVPILASLGTLILLIRAAQLRSGNFTALVAGAIYALLPMAGFFGRMPDQEAPCLFLMLAAVLAADRQLMQSSTTVARIRPGFTWTVCITAAIWMDWVAIILAALVCMRALHRRIRGRITSGLCARIVAPPAAAIILLLVYLLHFGFAGRAADLFAVFTARAGVSVGSAGPALHALTPWTNTVDNLTLPIIALAVMGLVISCRRDAGSPTEASVNSVSPSGLTLLAITGAVWIALFWRQYLVHQYWLYYLGPAVAIFAARAVVWVHRTVAARLPIAALAISAVLAVATIAASHITMMDLHKRVHCPMSDISAWRESRNIIVSHWGTERSRLIPPPPTILVRSPIHIERRKTYEFRNIVPPQFAYYFDLTFIVETDLDRIAEILPNAAALLMPTPFAAAHATEISSKLPRMDHNSYGTWELLHKQLTSF